MSTTVAQVKSIASEFAALDDSVVQDWIDIAAEYVSESFWGTKFDFVEALMTAHMMTSLGVSGATSSSGSVSSERLGDIAVSYSVTAVSADSLSSTRYGAQIEQLMKRIQGSPICYG